MFKHSNKLFAILAAFALLFVYACEPAGNNKQSKGQFKTCLFFSGCFNFGYSNLFLNYLLTNKTIT